jgi:hypothetical protein
MNGESKRSFAVAIASFAIGAVVAGILGNAETRAKLSQGSKNFVKNTKKLARRNNLA